MITKNKFVTVTYELRTNKGGDTVEVADAEHPLEFICGQGQTLEYFEMNLLGLNEGDDFDFNIPAANAYGTVNEDMIVELPRDIFAEVEAGELVPGNVLPMQDSLGRHLNGKITDVKEDAVVMDFNHPMAGNDLFFTGKVIAVRDATDEELASLHSHKCGGCHGCGSEGGCGDHSCGDGCCH
ncbi:MAG: peptidylprolyl isomerase [Marinifilaceae bacterium]|nr:peptidylprolyl isomerase [Marinifilaceae bacterium]